MTNTGQMVPDHIDDSAPIVPNEGLGGLTLRRPAQELEGILNSLPGRYSDDSWMQCFPPWEVRFSLGAVSVAVDIRSGSMFKLIAEAGYRGMLRGLIHVGMTVEMVRALAPDLYYDESRELLLFRDEPGVAADVSLADLPPDVQTATNAAQEGAFLARLRNAPIVSISVFDTALLRDYQ